MSRVANAKVRPRWYWIPLRVLLITFILTLLSFAVTLLVAILGMVVLAGLRGSHPDMTVAYRHVAAPAAAFAGSVALISALFMEIRHYRQRRPQSPGRFQTNLRSVSR